MSKVFKSASDQGPRAVSPYERSVLEQILTEMMSDDPVAIREHVLAEAKREAETKVQEAYGEGYKRGMETARADFQEQVNESASALKLAAQAIQESREQFHAALEPQLVELALRIAERILHREAETDRDLITRTAREAIRNLADRERIIVRLHPMDLQAIRAEKLKFTEEFDGIAQIRVEIDETIAPGGCIAESESMQVDARIEAQLEAILESLKKVNGRAKPES